MKFFLKKVIACCISLALAGSLLAGCGSNTAAENSTAASTTVQATTREATKQEETIVEKVTLTGMTFTSWLNDGTDAMFKAIADKTGITVDMQKIPEGIQGNQLVATKVATNDLPDIVVYHSGSFLPTISADKNFVDLSNEPWASSIFDTLKGPLSYTGKLYGPPFVGYGMNIGGIVYNKKVFSDLNLEIPKTWSEMLDTCEKIKAANKVPVYFSLKDLWTNQLLLLESIPYIEAATPDFVEKINTNQLKFADTPAYVQALGRAKELKDKEYINKDYLAATYDNAQKAISNGDAAMYPMATWIMDQIAANYPDCINDLGAFPMPAPDGQECQVAVWAAGGVYIAQSSKNVDAAKKWIEAYASPEIQSVYYKTQKGLPLFKGVESEGLYPVFTDLLKYMDEGKSTLVLEAKMVINIDELDKTIAEVIVEKTPEQGAKDIDAKVEKAAKSKNLPGW